MVYLLVVPKPEAVLSSGSYMGLVRSADLSAVGTSGGSRSNVKRRQPSGILAVIDSTCSRTTGWF